MNLHIFRIMALHLLWGVASFPLPAQQTGVDWLTTKEGLSQGFISNVFQDREGFVWLCTKNGLNRYDGYRFEVYTHDPYDPHSLSSDYVINCAEYGDFLIVGTRDAGLNLFHKKTQRAYRIPNDMLLPGFTLTTVHIIAAYPDYAGNIWVQAQVVGILDRLIKISVPAAFWEHPEPKTGWESTFRFHVFDHDVSGIFCLDKDAKRVYMPIGPDVFLIDIPSGNQSRLMLPPLPGPKDFLPDPLGNIWFTQEFIGDKTVLYRMKAGEPASLTQVAVPPGFQYLQALGTDHIWLYSDRRCWLFRLDEAGRFDPNDPAISPLNVAPGFYSILTDRSGLVWLGTNGLGVMKFNPRSGGFHHLFPGQSIYGKVMQDREGRIFAYNNIPAAVFSNELAGGGRQEPPFWPGKDRMHHSLRIEQDNAGNYWMAGVYSHNGTFSLKKMTPAGHWKEYVTPLEPFHIDYIVLLVDEGDHPWIALQGQLLHFNPTTEQFERFDYRKALPEASGPTALAKCADGSWWIGTDKGLLRAKPGEAGFEYQVFRNDPAMRNSLRNNVIAALLTDPADPAVLWIGTKGGGLNRLDTRSLQFTHLTTREGLPNNVIYGVLADDDSNLWMSSNKGLIRYTPSTGSLKNYTKEDGVQDNEFNTWAFGMGVDGNMLFGGVNGLTVFHPRELIRDTVAPRTLINGLRVNDQRLAISASGPLKQGVEFTHAITLPFSGNSLTLEFVSLTFVSPAKNRFRYYLDGAEAEWAHESAEHTASYLNLAPGTYTFRVKGSNSEGVWSEQPAELTITILPPWYRTWGACIAYILLLGGGFYAFYRYQLRSRLEHAENERLKELDAFKTRFFTNVTHEFRTPLTVILGMTDRLEKNVKDEKEKASALQLIRRNGQNLLRLINEILDLAKLESNTLKMNYIYGDVLPYLRYISESLHSLANAKNLLMRVESPLNSIEMDYDPERLLQIVYNLLSNAVKFTPGGGRVTLRVDQRDNWLHVEVSDTGIGIPNDDLPHIFERFYQAKNQQHNKAGGTGVGLSLTRELVRALGGDISASSEEGKGTVFSVRLPVTRNAPPAETEFSRVASDATREATLPAMTARRQPGAEIPQLLIIEDNADVVEYLSAGLRDLYALDFAYNGRAGIEKATETLPDIIISDVMMPEKDGFEVCDCLKNDERTSHIPIILLTARATVEDRIAGLRRGADAYLAKPFDPEELLVVLDNLIRLRARLQARYAGGHVPAPSADKGIQMEDAFLQKVRAVIEANLSDPDFEMPQMERGVGMSRSQIFRKMKALTGQSPSQFIRSIRLEKARQLLATSDLTVSEIAYETGFSSLQYFSDVFFEAFGKRPSATRN